jgi:hypothetical protein
MIPRVSNPPWAALVALVALAAVPAVPALAFRDCSSISRPAWRSLARTTRPMVSGFYLPAASVRDGEERAARLGFRIDSAPGEGDARAGLDRGFIAWRPALESSTYGGIPTPAGSPVVAPGHVSLFDRPIHSQPGAAHPNGALAVTGVIAVVTDLDDARSSMSSLLPSYSDWQLVFGKPRALVSLGALSRTAKTVDGGAVTLLAPLDPDGPVARWLAAGGPRWLGVAIAVEDLHRTAALFDRNEVAYERLVIEGLTHVVVPLAEGDRSPLAFFVRVSARRRPL